MANPTLRWGLGSTLPNWQAPLKVRTTRRLALFFAKPAKLPTLLSLTPPKLMEIATQTPQPGRLAAQALPPSNTVAAAWSKAVRPPVGAPTKIYSRPGCGPPFQQPPLPAIPHSPKAHQAPNPRSSKVDKTPYTKPKSTHLGQTARGIPIPNRLAAFPHGASKPKTVKSPNVKMGKICRFSNYLDHRASQESHRCLEGKGNRRLGQASPSLGGSNPNTVIQAKFITSKKHFAGLRMNEVQATGLSAGLIAEKH